MSEERKELKEIFNRRLNTICFDEYIDEKLAGDFIYNLLPLLDVDTCSYRIERRESVDSGHIWLEVLSGCGESFEFENDAYRYFNFCPYCGGKMRNQNV